LGGQSERAHRNIGGRWQRRSAVRVVQSGLHRGGRTGGLCDKRRDSDRVENGNNQTKVSIII